MHGRGDWLSVDILASGAWGWWFVCWHVLFVHGVVHKKGDNNDYIIIKLISYFDYGAGLQEINDSWFASQLHNNNL